MSRKERRLGCSPQFQQALEEPAFFSIALTPASSHPDRQKAGVKASAVSWVSMGADTSWLSPLESQMQRAWGEEGR